jgi:hypothetical protein
MREIERSDEWADDVRAGLPRPLVCESCGTTHFWKGDLFRCPNTECAYHSADFKDHLANCDLCDKPWSYYPGTERCWSYQHCTMLGCPEYELVTRIAHERRQRIWRGFICAGID